MKQKFKLVIVVLSFAVIGLTCKKVEPDTTGSISGTVRDVANNNPLIATITLSPDNKTITSSTEGIYQFKDLNPEKVYELKFSCNTYIEETRTNITVVAGQNTPVDVRLGKLHPTIQITSPSSGTFWQINKLQLITWTSTDISGTVKIDLIKESSIILTIEPSTENDGQYQWTIPLGMSEGNNFKIKISSLSDANISDESDFFSIYELPRPLVTTINATNVSSSMAVLNGTVNANGAEASVIFEYGTTASYGKTIEATPNNFSGNSATSVSAEIIGLIPNTLYHFRVKAENSAGISTGEDVTFVTTNLAAPTAKTKGATNVSSSIATLNGEVNGNGMITQVYFEYGTTIPYSNTQAAIPSAISGSITTNVSVNISGLMPLTNYHFRVKATSAAGTSYGNDTTFVTPEFPVPTVITQIATNITQNSAILNGTVNANNQSIAVTFEYGATNLYGTEVNATPSTVVGNANTDVIVQLSNLQTSCTYHFRLKVTVASQTFYGQDVIFTTLEQSDLVYDYEGNAYHTVKIANRTWMAENLISLKYADGTDMELADVYPTNYTDTFVATYGRHYKLKAAMRYTTTEGIQGACPTGWHLPSASEWSALSDSLNGMAYAGGKLKEQGLAHWNSPNTGATNITGFTGLPAGHAYFGNAEIQNIGIVAEFWTSTLIIDWAHPVASPYFYYLSYDDAYFRNYIYDAESYNYYGLSVRCVKNQ